MVLRGETKEAHSQGRLGLGEREDQGVDWVVGGAGGVEGCGGVGYNASFFNCPDPIASFLAMQMKDCL